MMAMKCDEEILCYLNHIKEVWFTLLQQDKEAMSKVDQATVKALELQAPRASTLDAKALRIQMLGGGIFAAFSDDERAGIFERLKMIDCLIPTLYTFFEDINYLKLLVNCMKWVTSLSATDTVSTALEKAFCANQQVAKPTRGDRVDLGCRYLYAYAMRHFLDMPRESNGKNLLEKQTIRADKIVLRQFADLSDRLGFESPEITVLKQYPHSVKVKNRSQPPKHLFVTDGPGENRQWRCGIPRQDAYEEDREFLYLNHLHMKEEVGEGITSFFVRRSVYFAFFGKRLNLELLEEMEQEMERDEMELEEHVEVERLELESQEIGRQQQKLDEKQQEIDELERQRQELERRLQAQRQEFERQRQELGVEHEKQLQAQRQLEVERLELERRLQAQRQEFERQRQELGVELERQSQAQRQEFERQRQELGVELERQLQAQRQLEVERLELERQLQAQRQQLEVERQKQQYERPEQGKDQGQDLQEQQRLAEECLFDNDGLDGDDATSERLNDNQAMIKEHVEEAPSDLGSDCLSASPSADDLDDSGAIKFRVRKEDKWKTIGIAHDSRDVAVMANKYIREGQRLFSAKSDLMTPKICHETVVATKINRIYLIPEDNMCIDEDFKKFIHEDFGSILKQRRVSRPKSRNLDDGLSRSHGYKRKYDRRSCSPSIRNKEKDKIGREVRGRRS